HLYAVAVFIAHTRAGTPERLAFMQRVSELVEANWSGGAPPAALPIKAETPAAPAAPARAHRHHRHRHAAKAARRHRRHRH
ncbi:MAG TPA: hypothetical protein VHX64_17920, partial [Caulobacteraceae bacterium]|nr:hypothetical protein [Caulobacteraceae bacterium]